MYIKKHNVDQMDQGSVSIMIKFLKIDHDRDPIMIPKA
jgi:hypothetical protein